MSIPSQHRNERGPYLFEDSDTICSDTDHSSSSRPSSISSFTSISDRTSCRSSSHRSRRLRYTTRARIVLAPQTSLEDFLYILHDLLPRVVARKLPVYRPPRNLKPLILPQRLAHSDASASRQILFALPALRDALQVLTANLHTPEERRGLKPLILPARLASRERVPRGSQMGLKGVISITVSCVAGPLDVIMCGVFTLAREWVEMDGQTEGSIVGGLCEYANMWILW